MTGYYLAAFIAVVGLGAGLQGLTGFGAGLVIMGVMTQFADPKALVPQVSLVGLALTATMLVQLRGHFKIRHALPLFIAMAVGTVVGATVFIGLPANVVKRTIGGVLVVASVLGLLRPETLHFMRNKLWGYPMGFLGGCMSAFNTPGPAVAHYAYAQDWTMEEKKIVLQIAFGLSALLRVGEFTATGFYTWGTLAAPLAAIPIGVGAVIAGHALSGRLHAGQLTKAVYVILVGLGAVLLVRG